MTEARVLTEDEAVELLALLLTSARIQLDEPAQYGPLRLLTAAERLSNFMLDRTSPETQRLLKQATETIPDMHMNMSDIAGYTAALDALCRTVGEVLVARSRSRGGAA